MNNKVVLLVGAILVAIGIFRPDFSNLLPKPGPVVVDTQTVVVEEPTNPSLKEAALKVAEVIKNGEGNRKVDGLALASLYADIAMLISLDEENEVVKTTNDIREINSVSGSMMNLKLSGKYPGLSTAARELVIGAVGDDIAVLNEESRKAAVEAFNALSWGCSQGAK